MRIGFGHWLSSTTETSGEKDCCVTWPHSSPLRSRPPGDVCSYPRMTQPISFDMPLDEAMTTQRAIRRLKPDPVDDALVLKLIELALKAPTGSNAQNWEVVRNRCSATVSAA
jgi:hypothetical protein